MGTTGAAVIVFVAILAAGALAWLIARFNRVRSRRQIDRDLIDRLFRDVQSALTDPVLIHQARRRVWSSRHL
jgi:hypothetical protein